MVTADGESAFLLRPVLIAPQGEPVLRPGPGRRCDVGEGFAEGPPCGLYRVGRGGVMKATEVAFNVPIFHSPRQFPRLGQEPGGIPSRRHGCTYGGETGPTGRCRW